MSYQERIPLISSDNLLMSDEELQNHLNEYSNNEAQVLYTIRQSATHQTVFSICCLFDIILYGNIAKSTFYFYKASGAHSEWRSINTAEASEITHLYKTPQISKMHQISHAERQKLELKTPILNYTPTRTIKIR